MFTRRRRIAFWCSCTLIAWMCARPVTTQIAQMAFGVYNGLPVGMTTSSQGALQIQIVNDVIAAWGDSLTQGAGGQVPYPTQLAAMLNAQMFNEGVGGDTSTQIAALFQANPSLWSYRTIIWSGRNNYTDPTTVKADIAQMVSTLTSGKYLVLSIINGDYSTEYIGQSGYNTITTLNSDLASIYPDHYLDVRVPLVAAYDPTNAQDVIDRGHDIPPSSLRIDSIHLTTAGYTVVARQIAQWLEAHQ